ncbi:MAG: peptide chain release factor 2 [Elusimicrobiota bacterium]
MLEDRKNEAVKLDRQIEEIRGFFELAKKEKTVEELKAKTSQPDFWNDNENARKVMKELDIAKSDIELYTGLKSAIDDIKTLIELAEEEEDDTLLNEISVELEDLKKKVSRISFRLRLSGKMDRKDAIITLNAGAGGTESCDWVEILTRMYRQWAVKNGYKTEVLDVLPGDEAGIKRITMIISGDYVYGYLQGETGVHRLVRISPFDSSKRRHTSFAACDVIPNVEEDINIDINNADLRIDTYRASGHGGQHVNKTDSAVRITHHPTGIVVQCQDSPSQLSNKKTAMLLLKSRLYEYEEDKKRAAAQQRYDEKGEIGWGHQIRSYVFMPYQMVRDHRTGVKVSNIDAVMNGEIDEFIDAYLNMNAES